MPSRRFVFAMFLTVSALALAGLTTPDAALAQGRRGGGRGAASDSGPADPFTSAVRAMRLRLIGPAVISGRISDVAVDPTDHDTWYVATASGGLWKTTTHGVSFSPIFDGEGS